MEFRIKNTYQYRCKKSLSNGNFLSSEIPELIFAWSDENAIENTLKDIIKPLYLKVDRMSFNKILNIDTQSIYFYKYKRNESVWEKIKTKSIHLNRFNCDDFDTLFNDLSSINLEFAFEGDKTKLNGKLKIINKNNYSIKIVLKKKIAFILGLLTTYDLDDLKNSFIEIIVGDNSSIITSFDFIRPFKEIKLYSKFMFNYATELCFKTLSKNEMSFQQRNNLDFDFDLNTVPLSCKIFKLDRFSPFDCKFYFVDFFNEYIYFDYINLTIFISNK